MIRDIETELNEIQKLVEDMEKSEANIVATLPQRRKMTKKHARHKAPAHIRPHTLKGRVYYYYVEGAGKEIYLGSAETILSWKPDKAKK